MTTRVHNADLHRTDGIAITLASLTKDLCLQQWLIKTYFVTFRAVCRCLENSVWTGQFREKRGEGRRRRVTRHNKRKTTRRGKNIWNKNRTNPNTNKFVINVSTQDNGWHIPKQISAIYSFPHIQQCLSSVMNANMDVGDCVLHFCTDWLPRQWIHRCCRCNHTDTFNLYFVKLFNLSNKGST